MASKLQRGFKAGAERTSGEYRQRIGLTVHDRLDPFALAEHLKVEVLPLDRAGELGLRPEFMAVLKASESRFLAVTVCFGDLRFIVYNSSHSSARTANTLTHELSHIICKHPPGSPLGIGGCRQWDDRYEDEANCLAGALLIPRDGLFQILRRDGSFAHGAEHYGVSTQLFSQRAHITGVVKVLGLLKAS